MYMNASKCSGHKTLRGPPDQSQNNRMGLGHLMGPKSMWITLKGSSKADAGGALAVIVQFERFI
jgi:hypothetical protein